MFPGSRFLCTVCRLLLQKFFQSLSRQPAARHKQQRHPQKSKQKQHILPCDRLPAAGKTDQCPVNLPEQRKLAA